MLVLVELQYIFYKTKSWGLCCALRTMSCPRVTVANRFAKGVSLLSTTPTKLQLNNVGRAGHGAHKPNIRQATRSFQGISHQWPNHNLLFQAALI